MGVVTKSHPRGFITEQLFHIEQIYSLLTLSLKITSGEISADEQQGRAEAKQRNITDKKLSRKSAHWNTFNHFKSTLQKISNNPSLNSVHQCTNQTIIQPLITHPEERIWAGRTPRVPDAPKIKHDRMKQFYMIDIGRKMWYYHLIKKVRIPLAREGKISLAMRNQTIQRTKIDFAEGWQTRGT